MSVWEIFRITRLIPMIEQTNLCSQAITIGSQAHLPQVFAATYIPWPTAGFTVTSRVFTALYHIFIFSGGMYLTAQYSVKPINAFTNALSPYLDNIYLDPDIEKYKNLLTKYHNMRSSLDSNNSQILDYYFLMYRTWLYDISSPEWRRFVIKNISMYLDYNLKIFEPQSSKRLTELHKNMILI